MEKTVKIPVFGMSCEHCVQAVSNALRTNKGVCNVQVSLTDKKVQVVYDDEIAGLENFKSIIMDEGFKLTE